MQKTTRKAGKGEQDTPNTSFAESKQTMFQQAFALHQQGQIKQAQALYQEVLKRQPEHFDSLHFLGVSFIQTENPERGAQLIAEAIKIKPDVAEAHNNRGNALRRLNRPEEALASYEQALSLKPNYAEAYNNRGNALRDLKRPEEALASYEQALSFRTDYADAYYNRGNALQDLNHLEKALASYDQALSLKPDHTKAYYNRGNVLKELNRLDAAIESYDQALALKPDYFKALITCLYQKHQICSWDFSPAQTKGLQTYITGLINDVIQKDNSANPFPLLALLDEPDVLQQASRSFGHQYQSPARVLKIAKSPSKLKIAYLSSDFCIHPTSYLIAELFELHNRQQFEVYAFSYTKDNEQSKIRQRLEKSFDCFFDVSAMSAAEVADKIQDLGIHIAINLKGYTKNGRQGILASRPAPIQVQYLGYPGTLALPFIDYMIADKVLIPEKERAYYTENILYMPDTYQVNDRKLEIATSTPARTEAGLPEAAFVFACFNNSYKILPAQFELWCDILKSIPKSVLWLFEGNSWVAGNLKKEAAARGIEPNRLIFAPQIPHAEHLARVSLADLFLDSHPCNAHTTASDALRVGVPVLTRPGRNFAARVAASLLSAIDLAEMITNSDDEYKARAITLAQHPAELAKIKNKLAANIHSKPLFDTPRFVHNLEAGYLQMWQRYQSGKEPTDITLTMTESGADKNAKDN